MYTFRSIIILVTTIVLNVVCGGGAHGQTWTMVNNDTLFINACSQTGGVIYDNGGPNGNYSNSFNGWVVIESAPGVAITLSGNYNTESCCDHITVWDGTIAGGTQLSYNSGSGTLNLSATSGRMTIQFQTDGSVINSGFELNWSRSGLSNLCTSNISGLTASNITTTSAVLSWSADESTLKLDYGQGEQTVTGSSVTLTGLNPNTFYTVRLYAEGEAQNPCCVAKTSFRTSCGAMSAPVAELFDDYDAGEDVYPTCWSLVSNIDGTTPANVSDLAYHSGRRSLRMSTTQSGYYSIAIMPEIVTPSIGQLTVRLKLRAPYSNTKLEVGVCNGTEQFNHSFTPIDTLVVTTANTWTEFLVPLDAYSGSGRRVALRMAGNLQPGNNHMVYVDDIFIESCGIWQISMLKRNASDLWLQWSDYGSPTVNVEYGPVGFASGSGVTLSAVTSPLHVSGLDYATQYEFRFSPLCGTSSANPQSFTASTLEGPDNNLSLCYGFEEGGNVPSGWRRHNVYSSTPQTSTSYRHSGSRSLQLRPNRSTTTPLVVLPMVDTVPISHLSLSFYVYSPSYTSGRIEVGVLEYPEDPSSFEPLDTLPVDVYGRWLYQYVSLADYSGNGKYIALRAFDVSTSSNSMYIDDLRVGTCLPKGVSVTNIGAHKVELRWDLVDANYHGDSIIVEYGAPGFADGQGTRLAVAVRGTSVQSAGGKQKYTLTGLEAETNYEFRIYGQCSVTTNSCAVATLNVQTLAHNISLPFCTDFEGMTHGAAPSGWTRTSIYGSEPCVMNDRSPRSGTGLLSLYADGNLSRGHSTVAMPLFDVDSVRGLTVSFYVFCNKSSGGILEVGVFDDPNDESSFVPVDTVSPAYNSWSAVVCDLSSYSGSGLYIGFRWYYNDCNGCNYLCYIDDLTVSDAATRNPSVISVTSHGATFNWSGCGRAYNGAYVEWGPAGFSRGSGTKDTVDAHTFSLTIDTLQPGRDYDAFITAVSSDASESCNYTRHHFTTFGHPTAASWCYGFEDMPNVSYPYPDGWTRPLRYEAEPRGINDAHSGNYSMYLRSYFCGSTVYKTMVVLPFLEEQNLSGLTLRFWAKGYGNQSRLAVGFLSDPNDASSFDTLALFTPDHSGEWRQYSVDLGLYAGSARHIAFFNYISSSCNSGWVYIDDITINRCLVGNVRTYSESTDQVTIDWVPSGSIDSVQVEYGPAGFLQGTGSVVSTTDSVVTLSGLPEAGATYDFYVRPFCSGSSQACSEFRYQFSTTTQRVGIGYCFNFEDNNGNYGLPTHWSRPAMQDVWPEIWVHSDNQYYTSPNSAFEYRAHDNGCNIAVMPASQDPLSQLVVSLMVRGTNVHHPERASLIVGAMPNPFDTALFVPLDTIHPSYYYRRYDVSLSSYSGPFRHIAFKYIDPSNSYNPTYTDDLILSRCRPSNLRASAVTDSSVTLSWDRLGYSGATTILYGLDGTPFSQADTLVSHSNSVTLSGLLPDSSYWFCLFGSCSDTLLECQAAKISLRTLAEPMRAPVCFDFESGSLASGLLPGWTRPYGFYEAGVSSNNNHTLGGSRSISLFAYNCNNANEDRTNMLVLPLLQAPSLDGLWLEFYAFFENSHLSLDVGFLSDPADTSSFSLLASYSGSNSWQRILLDLSAFQGSGRYLAFRSRSAYCSSGFVYVDDISLRSCALLSASVGQPTLHSLTLQFSATSSTSGLWVEYKAVGDPSQDFTPGSGDSLLFIPSSPFTFSTLQEATWYAFHLYPDCGGGNDGCNYLLLHGQTLHPPVSIPYCESFDLYSSGQFPNNWRRHSSYSPDSPRIYDYISHSASNTLFFETGVDSWSMAVLPQTLVGPTCPVVDSLYVNFWTFSDYNWNSAALVVGTLSDANDPSSFVPSDTVRLSAHALWEHHTVPIRNFHSDNTYIALKFFSLANYYATIRVDDLCVEKCVASNVSVSSITQNSVTISWDSYGVDSLVVEYGPAGFEAGTGTLVTLTSSPAVISGLLDGTDYQFSFASVCGCNSYGSTYFPGGGSGGGYGGGGCRWCGYCWGWYWDDLLHSYRWCWGPWQHHPWNYNPFSGGSGGGGNRLPPPLIDSVRTQSAFLDVPYCEGFEHYDTLSWPRSWRRIGGQTPGFPSLTTSNAHSGNRSLDFYASPGSSNFAALPPLPEGLAPQTVLSFFAYATNANAASSNARFIVGIMSDPDDPSSFFPLDTVRLASTARWEQHFVDLASYSGNGQYIAFRFAPVNASYHFYLDDLFLSTCAVVNPLLSTSPSAVTLSWTPVHSPHSVLLEYGPQGFSPGGDSSIATISLPAPPVNLSDYGISPLDNLDLYLTPLCSDSAASCFNSPLTLNPRLFTPYCEDFEGLPNDVLPPDWKVVRRRDVYPLTQTQHGQQVVTFYPCTGTNDNVVLLPPLPDSDSLHNKWLYASLSAYSTNYIFLDFGTLSDTNNASSFIQMASLSCGAAEQLREYNVRLSSTADTRGARLAIRARSTSGCRWIRLATMVLADCPYPTDIVDVPLGIARRRISWSNLYDNPYYGIVYGYGDHWQSIPLSDSCSATLTGLLPGHSYQVFFVSPAGERLCLPYSFSTPEYISLPHCDNFESYPRYSSPSLWVSYNNRYANRDFPRTEVNGGSQCLQFYNSCYSNQWCSATLPDIDIDSIRHASLRFRLHIDYGNTNSMLIVGVQSEQYNTSTFVPVDTLYYGSPWRWVNLSLSRYRGDGRYITFRYKQTNGSCHYAYIDDLSIAPCPLPTLSVAGAHAVRAEVAGLGSEVDYWLEYDTAGFERGTGTLLHVTSNPCFITGLQAETSYSFRRLCSEDEADCEAPLTLTTAPQLSLPYCDDFGAYPDGSMPSGWYSLGSQNNGYPQKNWNGHLQFYNSCTNGSRSYAVLPDLDIDSLSHAEVYFNLYSERCQFLMVVGVMSDPNDPATFVPVDTLQNSANNLWEPMHVSLHAASHLLPSTSRDGRFLAFCMVNTTGNCYSCYIDDLRVAGYPTPRISLAGANTIRVVRGSAADFWVELAPEGTPQGADQGRWFHVTRDTFDITGLPYLTSYDLYHHADSGGTTCFPLVRVATSTLLPMPWCDNFNAYDNYSLPTSWRRYCSRSGHDYPQIHHNKHLHFYCYQGDICQVAMPELDIDSLRHAHLYFNMMTRYSQYAGLVVGVMSDPDDWRTFVGVDTLRNVSTTDSWEAKHVSLSRYGGGGRFLAFRMVNTNGWREVFVDDLYIQPCPRPSVTLVGGTTVRLEAGGMRDEADYWLEYGPQGIVPGQADTLWSADSTAYTLTPHNTLLHITSDTLTISSLLPHTSYDFHARCDSLPAACYPLTARITTSRLQPLPYCEEFTGWGTGSGVLPQGWKWYATTGAADRVSICNHGDAPDRRSLRFYSSRDNYAYAVLPDFDIADLGDVTLRARMWTQCGVSPATAFLEVGVMEDMEDIGTFRVVDTLRNTTACTWEMLSAHLQPPTTNLQPPTSQTARFIALRMRETNNSWRSLYLDRLEVVGCDLPADLRATLHSHNTVRILASDSTRTGFWVEYGPTGFAQGSGTILFVDRLPADIVVGNHATYDFYFLCDTLTATCAAPQTVTTLDPPVALSHCQNFAGVPPGGLPQGWRKMRLPEEYGNDCYVGNGQAHSGSRALQMCSYYPDRHPYAVLPDLEIDSLRHVSVSFWMRNNNHNTFIVELGVMSDPNDPATFLPVKQFKNSASDTWQRMQATLADIPGDARFLALRLTKTNNSWDWVYIDDLNISPCGADRFHVTAVESDQVTFDWQQTGSPQVTLEYGPAGFPRGQGTLLPVDQDPPYTLTGLDNLTNYSFYFSALCDALDTYCTTDYLDSASVFTPAGGSGCIDPTNLTAPYTTCFVGTYSNPYASQQIVDHGCTSVLSRHTVHYDPSETDPRTGGMLHTVPEGSEASVRLGNWGSGSQAEAVSYSLAIDTANFDLLLLRYAAVLQDNDHPSVAQPRFKLEILDENGELVDSCSAADFIANQSLGWNLVPESYVLWKDWTTVGVDLTPLHGRTVTIRLTVFDCNDGDHFGYAYFTLNCMTKTLVTSHCGEATANSFSAPPGFNYRWYTNQSDTTLSSDRTIVVPTNNNITYYCDLSFIDNSSCFFTMSAFAGTRYPLALFDTAVVIRDCHFEVSFTNQSTISMDGVTPIGSGEGTESAHWLFGNGTSSAQYHPTAIYHEPGTYTVRLVSSIAGGSCTDTLEQEITLAFPPTDPHIEGPTDRCLGAVADTLVVLGAASWSPWSDDSLAVSPAVSTTYTLNVTDSNGCPHTLSHTLDVHPIYDLHLHHTICDGSALTFSNNTYTTEGDYSFPSATDTYHCDSTTTLHLTVLDNSSATISETINESQLPWNFNGLTFEESNFYDQNGVGTSSLQRTVTINNANGCDSVINYTLNINWNTRQTYLDSTICRNRLPITWNSVVMSDSGTYSITYPASHGQDSVVFMRVHVRPIYNDTVPYSICDNHCKYINNSQVTSHMLSASSMRQQAPPSVSDSRAAAINLINNNRHSTCSSPCTTAGA